MKFLEMTEKEKEFMGSSFAKLLINIIELSYPLEINEKARLSFVYTKTEDKLSVDELTLTNERI